MPEQLRTSSRKARKRHRCDLCTGPIEPGEVYERAAMLYHGRVYDWVECPACVEDKVGVEVADYGDQDAGYTDADAYEWAHENADATEESGPMARRWLVRYRCDCERCEERAI